MKHTKIIAAAGVGAWSLIALGTVSGVAYAEQTNFSQRILPIDCVFEVVNDGTGTLYYVTPKECGVLVQPPVKGPGSTPVITQPTIPGVSQPVTTVGSSGPLQSAAGGSVPLSAPWAPIANTPQESTTPVSTSAHVSGAAVAGVGLAVVLVIILMAVLL